MLNGIWPPKFEQSVHSVHCRLRKSEEEEEEKEEEMNAPIRLRMLAAVLTDMVVLIDIPFMVKPLKGEEELRLQRAPSSPDEAMKSNDPALSSSSDLMHSSKQNLNVCSHGYFPLLAPAHAGIFTLDCAKGW
uniref:Uncharacterized protein n=1 Tax=Trichuris muris TaxID=70415 RepID=A0A5S6Q7C8_TRIMR